MPDLSALPMHMIEVATFAALIYIVLRFLRETRGSGVVRGLAFLLLVGVSTFVVLIQALELRRLGLLFDTIAQSVVIGLVIVFHPEIRRAIVHLGDSPIFSRFFQKESKIVQRVLRAVARMSKERIGALIAVEREASLQTLAESGITIDAELNSFLIESIFYPKSALHDGAIVVRDDRIVAASCLLPLSQNPDVDKRLGTRHRAALGLSEETDALAIIVSEENGRISAAQGGKLSYDLTLEQLERHMDEALGIRQRSQRSRDKGRGRASWTQLFRDPVRKLAALTLAVGLWFVLDSQITKDEVIKMTLVAADLDEQLQRQANLNRIAVRLPLQTVELVGFYDQSTGKEITEIGLEVSGPNYAVDNVMANTLALEVRLPAVDWSTVTSTTFSVTEIIPTATLSRDIELALDPQTVRVDVVRVANKQLQLGDSTVQLTFTDERTRPRVREVEYSKQSVTVTGPDSVLATLDNDPQPVLVAQLESQPQQRTVSANIRLRRDLLEAGLKLVGDACTVTAHLRPLLQPFKLQLPVVVLDQALPPEQRGLYVPEVAGERIPPEGLLVEVRAGGALSTKLKSFNIPEERDRYARHNLLLFVQVDQRPPGTIFPDELPILPVLQVMGPLKRTLLPSEYELVDPVTVTLRRSQ